MSKRIILGGQNIASEEYVQEELNKINPEESVVLGNLSEYSDGSSFDYDLLLEDYQQGGFLYAYIPLNINGKRVQRNSFLQVSNSFGTFVITAFNVGNILQFIVQSSGVTVYVFEGEVV